MIFPPRLITLIFVTLTVSLAAQAPARAQTKLPDPAVSAVRSFYTFHLKQNKNFSVRNVQQRKRWLTPDLYGLLLNELKRQAAYSKTHPDEAPDFEGDPFTDSQEYPSSFRVGKAEVSGDSAKVTITFLWGARSTPGSDKRDIVVELAKSGTVWLINDIVNNKGSRLRDDLKKEH